MKSNFKNVLLLSNTGIDMGRPDFRVGAYKDILLPIARNLEKEKEISVRILANKYVSQYLRNYSAKRIKRLPTIITLDDEMLYSNNAHNFMIDSYSNLLDEKQKNCAVESILQALEGWTPDIVISWETPTVILRSIFPEALVLDVMPGMFMRPPFPKMFSFDPVGLYKNCWYSDSNPSEIIAPDKYIDNHKAIRELYEKHFAELDIANTLNTKVVAADYKNATVVPLQVTDYFGWKENTAYRSQFDLIEDIQRSARSDKDVIYTQYKARLISEQIIHNKNVKYLRNKYPNFIYSYQFEKLNNITQYIMPCAESVISISSTLGLQAKFFGKRLISPSCSHLSYIADGLKVDDLETAKNTPLDGFMTNYLGRTNFIVDRIIKDPSYMMKILNSFYQRKGNSSVEQFPSFEEVGNSLAEIRASSKFKTSKDAFQKAYPQPRRKRDIKIASRQQRVQKEDIKTVSFDVFDTLVCRTVLKPVDVFELIQAKLHETHLDVLGENFISSFASSRNGIERLIRSSIDAMDSPVREEMKIADIYKIMLEDHDLSSDLIDELVMIEQEMELSCLIPRNEGIDLYYSALSAGKRVIIISDFIHPTSFVERVLRKCGIDSWEKIYVSSDIGLKKHSGALFAYVKKDLNLIDSETLHIGDNPHGDIKMAESYGWQTQYLPSTPFLMQTQLKKANLRAVIEKSFMNRVIVSALANEFYKSSDENQVNSSEIKLINSTCELGFVTLGPMMYFFSRWLIDEAQKNKCTQIAFFARDSVLPYHMVNKILQEEGAPDITTCYLPVSRAAVRGLDIKSPQDLHKVRIDDFPKSKFLMELFECRFNLEPDEIDEGSVLKLTNKSIHKLKVGDIPAYAIYQIAKRSAQDNWDAYSKNILEKRALFERGLKQWGCDINKKTLTVDYGYRGSIHRRIKNFFKEPPLSRLFISHANNLGQPPQPYVKAFFLSNQVYNPNSPTLMHYNSFIETLLNEGTGSALGYCDSDGHIEVLREDSVCEEHKRIIKELHRGALQFSAYWIRNCQSIDYYAYIEPQMLSYILQKVISAPTQEIALMLANLNIENGYSGLKTQRNIKLKSSGKPNGGAWREGVNVLNKTKDTWFDRKIKRKVKKYLKYVDWINANKALNHLDKKIAGRIDLWKPKSFKITKDGNILEDSPRDAIKIADKAPARQDIRKPIKNMSRIENTFDKKDGNILEDSPRDATKIADKAPARQDIRKPIKNMLRIENTFVKAESEMLDCYHHIELPNYTTAYYGQHFEDVIMLGILRSIYKENFSYKEVTYIEIGANHPISGSNTYMFYKNGARGVLVEPNKDLHEILEKVRSKDKLIKSCVTERANCDNIDYYYLNYNELNTTSKKFIEKWNENRTSKITSVVKKVSMPAASINKILSENFADRDIDILSIDIEGNEIAIIETINFTKFTPKIICMEWNPALNGSKEDVRTIMNNAGYLLYSDTIVNGIFVFKKYF